ncbi:MAG: 6-pyruvoyl-tetrahydropterin synthase-related protein [Candidatus Korobacteraceae bacterium]
MHTAPPRLKATTVFALAFAALAVVAPYSVRGVACGHDLTFHMNSWLEVAQQWREGTLYPRWAVWANYGSGEPRFLFYPPLSWMLGGALGSVIPWLFVPVAFDVCAVLFAGVAMHALAREWFEEPDATLIAIAYAVNPYMLLNIYVRSAFAEMLAVSFLPLIVLWIVRDRPARQMVVPLALTIAGAWLTNVPAAIILSYATVVLLAVATIVRRNSRVFLYGAGAMALGLALASFYIVPVLFEKNWITVGQLLSAGVRPAENFLFARSGEMEHDSFLRQLSWLAVGELGITALATIAARGWRKSNPRLWWSLVALSLTALLLMLPITALAYRLMPDLRFVQFPWRWLMVVGVAYAVLVVAAIPRFRGKPWVYALLFAGLIAGCNLALQPRCDPADTPLVIYETYRTGYGYMGTDEYVPAGGDNYEIKPDFPEFRLRGEAGSAAPAGARVTLSLWSPYRKQMTVELPRPASIVLRLMNYPAWRATVNGSQVLTQSDDPTGRMVIALPAGHSDVDVGFGRTSDRWLGDGISLAAVGVLLGFWYVGRERHRQKRYV